MFSVGRLLNEKPNEEGSEQREICFRSRQSRGQLCRPGSVAYLQSEPGIRRSRRPALALFVDHVSFEDCFWISVLWISVSEISNRLWLRTIMSAHLSFSMEPVTSITAWSVHACCQ